MTMTDQATPARYPSSDDDPKAFRLPELSDDAVVEEALTEAASAPEKTQTELLIEEVHRAYLLQEIDLKTAAETPLFAEMLLSRREPVRSPEIVHDPLALRLIEAGDTILAVREAQINEALTQPDKMSSNRRGRLFDWFLLRNKPVNADEIRSFVTFEEHTASGTFYRDSAPDAPKEYAVQFERVPSREKTGETEDEWTIQHAPTGQVFRYAVRPDTIFKSHEGQYYPFAPGEHDLLETIVMIYHDRTKSRRERESA